MTEPQAPDQAHSLRVLHINTQDQGGGAAQVAQNLVGGLRTRNVSAWLAVGKKYTAFDWVLQIPTQNNQSYWAQMCLWLEKKLSPWDIRVRGVGRARRLLRELALGPDAINYWRKVEAFHYPASYALASLPSQIPQIMHAHNLHDHYFDLRALPLLSAQQPLLMTLHDSWLLSGNCAHSFSCERWKTGCGHCPDIHIPPGLSRDTTAVNWQRKQRIYAKSQLYIATPSQWLMKQVEQSILAAAITEARVIPNGVDTTLFCPGDQIAARRSLGIAENMDVLLFAANGIRGNAFKDYASLHLAIELIAKRRSPSARPLLVLALGEAGQTEVWANTQLQFIAHTDNMQQLVQYYQAADLYVHASKADTFPNTVLEAMACGIAVVASHVGGIPEQVSDGITGLLVAPENSQALAIAIETLLAQETLRSTMGQAGRKRVLGEFQLSQQIDRYLEWYEAILEAQRGARITIKN